MDRAYVYVRMNISEYPPPPPPGIQTLQQTITVDDFCCDWPFKGQISFVYLYRLRWFRFEVKHFNTQDNVEDNHGTNDQ